jgi:hypothetical protein
MVTRHNPLVIREGPYDDIDCKGQVPLTRYLHELWKGLDAKTNPINHHLQSIDKAPFPSPTSRSLLQ